MDADFKLALNNVKFEMFVEFEADDLNFSSRIHATTANIDHILARYRAIDGIHKVRLRCKEPLRIRYISTDDGPIPVSPFTPKDFFASQEVSTIEFYLDATIWFYTEMSVLNWSLDRELPDWVKQLLNEHCIAIKPVIIGTAAHYLPVLKQQAKDTVTRNAARRARIMLGNAHAILTLLNDDVFEDKV